MTNERIVNRLAALEQIRKKSGGDESLIDASVKMWGPLPADLKLDLEALDAKMAKLPAHTLTSDPADLDVYNRLARWAGTGNQRGTSP